MTDNARNMLSGEELNQVSGGTDADTTIREIKVKIKTLDGENGPYMIPLHHSMDDYLKDLKNHQ